MRDEWQTADGMYIELGNRRWIESRFVTSHDGRAGCDKGPVGDEHGARENRQIEV
jgi:hypothetical protein